MNTVPDALFLKRNALYSLSNAKDVQISCHDGVLWLTLDNDPRDIVLERGQSHTPSHASRALIHALRPSILGLSVPQAQAVQAARQRPLTLALMNT